MKENKIESKDSQSSKTKKLKLKRDDVIQMNIQSKHKLKRTI